MVCNLESKAEPAASGFAAKRPFAIEVTRLPSAEATKRLSKKKQKQKLKKKWHSKLEEFILCVYGKTNLVVTLDFPHRPRWRCNLPHVGMLLRGPKRAVRKAAVDDTAPARRARRIHAQEQAGPRRHGRHGGGTLWV